MTQEERDQLNATMRDFTAQMEEGGATPVIVIGAIQQEDGSTRVVVTTQLMPPAAMAFIIESQKGIHQAMDRYIQALEGKLALATATPQLFIPPGVRAGELGDFP